MEQLRNAFDKTEKFVKLPNNYFPFWNMKNDEQTVVRFVPDKNEANPHGFLIEKKTHKLTINGQERKIPCLDMYGEKCPICKVSRDYYKVNDEVNGKKYYRSVQYIAQGIVVESPLPVAEGEESPVGKIRLFAFGPQIYKIIKASFKAGELDEVPYDYKHGTDFLIIKDKQGEHANYSLSKFARRERALDDDTIANLELFDLTTILPKNPGLVKVTAMLEAEMNGEAYEDGEGNTNSAADDGDEPVMAKASVTSNVTASDDDEDGEAILARVKADMAARRSV